MEQTMEVAGRRLSACEILTREGWIDGLPGKRNLYGFRAVSEDGEEAVLPDLDVSREMVCGLISQLWEHNALMEELWYIVEDYFTSPYLIG